ncbi:cysteine hydrolase family protein [Geothrix mesophila]|uniref:cysteine hydrolase family protein n=1 Tax=Geothrix mesophila TaxID=2922723 RepID=UPI001FAD827F|nr:cysteine hydrolase family protein [Geothrix sp. SG198]
MPASPRRALIVIDVQEEYVTGDLPIEFPPIAESLANIGAAMDAAREAGIPVIVVQNHGPAGAPLFAKGSPAWELHEVVRSRPSDHYLEKSLPSAFTGTDLAEWLGARGIDTLAVVGYMTHNCVDSTIKHAMHAGLAVEFLADASGSVPYENAAGRVSAETIHRTFCVVLQSRFAAVTDTRTWVAAVRGEGPAPARGTIYDSNQRARGCRPK